MPGSPSPGRLLAFGVICVVLLGTALHFAGSKPDAEPAPEPERRTAAVLSAPGAEEAARAELDRAARRFLAAFLRYEVGEEGAAVRRELQETTTPAFVGELLTQPPRRPPADPMPAVIQELSISVLSAVPPRAVVSGSANRRGAPEQFSFVFEAKEGVWLAAGPAE